MYVTINGKNKPNHAMGKKQMSYMERSKANPIP
jgi:hypothetical protein